MNQAKWNRKVAKAEKAEHEQQTKTDVVLGAGGFGEVVTVKIGDCLMDIQRVHQSHLPYNKKHNHWDGRIIGVVHK